MQGNESQAGVLVADGNFRILRRIGRGAAGEVFAAEVVANPSKKVAIKFLLPRWAYDDEILKRFQREARIAQQLRSEFVAPFVGAGFDRFERLWIAFELLDGESLDRLLLGTESTPFRIQADDVKWIVLDLLRGLEDAHAQGVIHRDIKPGNIFVRVLPDGFLRALLLDFGVSKLRVPVPAGSATSPLTALGSRDRHDRVHAARADQRCRRS